MNEWPFAPAKVLVQWTNKRMNRQGKNQQKSSTRSGSLS